MWSLSNNVSLTNVIPESFKNFAKEKMDLKKSVEQNNILFDGFIDSLKTHYGEKEVQNFFWDKDPKEYLIENIQGFNSIDLIDKIVPWVKWALSWFDAIGDLGQDSVERTMKEFIRIFKDQWPWAADEFLKIQWLTSSLIVPHIKSDDSDRQYNYDIPNEAMPIQNSEKTYREDITQPELLKNIIDDAEKEIGITEKNREADKYLKELWYKDSSKTTPWCGAYVAWILEKNNVPLPKNPLSAKAFIDITGEPWHVGIKSGEEVISGNYGDKVSKAKIKKWVRWYAIPTPEGLQVVKDKNIEFNDIPDGAIVVYDRWKTDKNMV